MRPPDLPGGNISRPVCIASISARFNEAAGFTRRKHRSGRRHSLPRSECFNEAAGFTRRKLKMIIFFGVHIEKLQ